MIPKIEFIYDQDCPNVEATRRELMLALANSQYPLKWSEWDRNDPESPKYAKNYGSPTILVDRRDICDEGENTGNNCRVYEINGALKGVPSAGFLTEKLKNNSPKKFESESNNRGWKFSMASFPVFGLALIPKLTCAACWPAYAGIMSSLGFGFFNYTEYLGPIMVIALSISIVSLGFRAKRRRGYGPLALGILSAALIMIGKFSLESTVFTYIGVAILIVATIWNVWPIQSEKNCSACV